MELDQGNQSLGTSPDPVQECIESLLKNEIKALDTDDIFLDENDVTDAISAENVGAEMVRIFEALAQNESVEELVLNAVYTISGIGSLTETQVLAIGAAVRKRKKAFTCVSLHARLFNYESERIAIFVSSLAIHVHVNAELYDVSEGLEFSIYAPAIINNTSLTAGENRDLTSALRSLTLSKARVTNLCLEGISLFGESALAFARSVANQRDHLKRIKVNDFGPNHLRVSCSVGYALFESIGQDTEVDIELSIFEGAPDCHPLVELFGLRRNIKRFVLTNCTRDENEEAVISDSVLKSLALAFRRNKSAADIELRMLVGDEALLGEVMASLVFPDFVNKLTLFGCAISSMSVSAFSNKLKNCCNGALEDLIFAWCPFNDDSAEALGFVLEGNTTLKRLSITQSEVTDVGLRYISEGILNSKVQLLTVVMPSQQFQFRCLGNFENLLHPSSPLQTLALSVGDRGLKLPELKLFLDSFGANHTLRNIYLPCKKEAILGLKETISDLLQRNSCLQLLFMADNNENRIAFTTEEKKEMTEMLVRSLLVNHSLTQSDLCYHNGPDDIAARRLLKLNAKGIIAATAGKGVPLPPSFVQGLPNSAVPEAFEKILEKGGGLTGTFSFLRQIYFGNLIAAHIDHVETKKRPANNSSD